MAYSKEGNVFRLKLDDGNAKYWEQQREGFKRIAEWREALALAEKERSHRLRVHRTFWDSWPVVLGKSGYATAQEIPIFGGRLKKKRDR